jgi:TetR/AcrR family transcriptional repressor of nem operon
MAAESLPSTAPARQALLGAAITLIRRNGYSATSVDDLCRAAGVTKGAFFHHFASKDRLAVAAAEHFTSLAAVWFAQAPFLRLTDPADRVLGYVDFRLSRLTQDVGQSSCLLGTLVQEAYATSDEIREACLAGIERQAGGLEPDIAAALQARGLDLEPRALALHTQAVLQGAFILAKAASDIGPAVDSLVHLKRYLALLFGKPADEKTLREKTMEEEER